MHPIFLNCSPYFFCLQKAVGDRGKFGCHYKGCHFRFSREHLLQDHLWRHHRSLRELEARERASRARDRDRSSTTRGSHSEQRPAEATTTSRTRKTRWSAPDLDRGDRDVKALLAQLRPKAAGTPTHSEDQAPLSPPPRASEPEETSAPDEHLDTPQPMEAAPELVPSRPVKREPEFILDLGCTDLESLGDPRSPYRPQSPDVTPAYIRTPSYSPVPSAPSVCDVPEGSPRPPLHLLFKDAPSQHGDSAVAQSLRALRQTAMGGPVDVTFHQGPGSLTRREEAILPDGTIYRMTSTWQPDPQPPVCLRARSSQT